MWKVGSEPQSLTPHCEDQLDQLETEDTEVNSKTSIFSNPSIDFDKYSCKARSGIASGGPGAPGRPWGGAGRALGGTGAAVPPELGGTGNFRIRDRRQIHYKMQNLNRPFSDA